MVVEAKELPKHMLVEVGNHISHELIEEHLEGLKVGQVLQLVFHSLYHLMSDLLSIAYRDIAPLQAGEVHLLYSLLHINVRRARGDAQQIEDFDFAREVF